MACHQCDRSSAWVRRGLVPEAPRAPWRDIAAGSGTLRRADHEWVTLMALQIGVLAPMHPMILQFRTPTDSVSVKLRGPSIVPGCVV